MNSDGDGNEEGYIDESVNSFRSAGSQITDGLEHLWYGLQTTIDDLSIYAKGIVFFGLWFGGNWVYNRISTPLIDATTELLTDVPLGFIIGPVFGLADASAIPYYIQVLGILLGVVITQNRLHTRRLKQVEEQLLRMNSGPTTATDGGTRRASDKRDGGGTGVGGAIAGGFAGATFGPGGALAGAFLGYVIAEGITDEDDGEGSVPELAHE